MSETDVNDNSMEETENNIIELNKPLYHGKRYIEQLTLRDVTAKDMRTVKQEMTLGDIFDIGSKLCGEPRSVIDRLCAKDANELVDLTTKLLGGGD